MKKLKELRNRLAALLKEAKDITDKADAESRDLTEADSTAITAKLTEIKKVKGDIATLEALAEEERSAGSSSENRNEVTPPGAGAGDEGDEDQERGREERGQRNTKRKSGVDFVPVGVRRCGGLRNFKGAGAELRAYRFGVWYAASRGAVWAQKRAKEVGIEIRVHQEGDDNTGGVLVPDEFDADVIDLRESFGVIRKYARIKPMLRDTSTTPRRVGGLTAYFEGESDAGVLSTKNWNKIKLEAKKIIVLTKVSNELAEDAIINIGDDLMGEIQYAFSQKEDECAFNGDGTSAYGGILGIGPKIQSLSATRANIAGLVVGTGNAYSELVKQDFSKVKAKLPSYADTPNARWFCHKSFFAEVMEPLILAAGGAAAADFMNGAQPRFLGYEVVYVQVMPKVEANDQICAILGDLYKGVRFGDRRQSTISQSDSALNAFEQDEIAIRGTERFDINVHDVGNASATVGARVPGPIVALATAAS